MAGLMERNRGAVVALWYTRQYDTAQIADLLVMREADVERIIHADREFRNSQRVAA